MLEKARRNIGKKSVTKNPNRIVPSIYKSKSSGNYQTFSEDTKKVETLVRKYKRNNFKKYLSVDLFILHFLFFSLIRLTIYIYIYIYIHTHNCF